jgi:hypothetical protein
MIQITQSPVRGSICKPHFSLLFAPTETTSTSPELASLPGVWAGAFDAPVVVLDLIGPPSVKILTNQPYM